MATVNIVSTAKLKCKEEKIFKRLYNNNNNNTVNNNTDNSVESITYWCSDSGNLGNVVVDLCCLFSATYSENISNILSRMVAN